MKCILANKAIDCFVLTPSVSPVVKSLPNIIYVYYVFSAGLSSGERICLNPRTPWVKKLILFIERKERVTKKV